MPTDAYMQHLESQLASVEAKLTRAKAAIDEGGPEDRAKALDEWSHLKMRPEHLLQKVEAAKRDNSADWSVLHTSFREEADALCDTLERWLTRVY
ncbi:hypothetical protein [Jannaschia seohaensis]|uniref:Uncharacterized protein n=1 Tax=Jannaschia seohaensis TaxID=475081 RepID=A0A2Y9AIH9_9RHOB|nr:hypothetical protein [Jannaschia seohaensis]PWJ20264.1 hypothetical protein BCF38_10379 [Jannaschia seohaensis]SSA44274.1 hypothetical protein SAMN05421539_10379 [Jannaschia seohaensis]